MEITFQATIPDDVAAELQNGSTVPLGRRLLELAAIRAYQADLISSRQVQEMLGFEDREELLAFFKANDVRDHHFTMEELERGRATMATLLDLSELLAQEARTINPDARREAVRRAKGSMRGLLPTVEQFLAEKHAELEREESKLPEPRA